MNQQVQTFLFAGKEGWVVQVTTVVVEVVGTWGLGGPSSHLCPLSAGLEEGETGCVAHPTYTPCGSF